jgi:hypothetical protein
LDSRKGGPGRIPEPLLRTHCLWKESKLISLPKNRENLGSGWKGPKSAGLPSVRAGLQIDLSGPASIYCDTLWEIKDLSEPHFAHLEKVAASGLTGLKLMSHR